MTYFTECVRGWLDRHPRWADVAAVGFLTTLWAFVFWRVLTPQEANQASYPLGDFSGQFVAFASYQAQRMLAGQIPLWNPYNYAGHPFLADTQSAVFYPIRLATIFISQWTGGMSYAALQAEAIAHYWLGSLWMFLFVRTTANSRIGGLVSAVTLAYGGYLTGYPPLQLAILEAGIWLPLALLGVYRATVVDARTNWKSGWLAVSALAVGVSLLAGHPQTSLFLTYVVTAYFIHRAVRTKQPWQRSTVLLALTFGLGYGLAGVQLLPGLEYARLTVRAGLGFDELAGGFPFGDLLVFLVPNVKTQFSPLYSGIAALVLVGIAIRRRRPSAYFWGITAGFGVLLSFGGLTVIYRLLYFVAPGLSWFRGQERAAFVVAHSIAILAGTGAATLIKQPLVAVSLRRLLAAVAGLAVGLAVLAFTASQLMVVQGFASVSSDSLLNGLAFLAILTTLCWALFGRMGHRSGSAWWHATLIALVIFDVVSLTGQTNWEQIPAGQRILVNESLVAAAQADDSLFRVDGRLGLGGNYGSMVGIQDIRGISPLRLQTIDDLFGQFLRTEEEYRLHQLLGVKYVFTDLRELPIPSHIIATDEWVGLPAYLHQLDEPLPRAWMVFQVMETPYTGQALGWLTDTSFDPSTTVILDKQPPLNLPAEPPSNVPVVVTRYEPERIDLTVDTPLDGVLVISEMDYPGWIASVDGERHEIWRADVALRALPLPAGQHQIIMSYQPVAFRIGTMLSIVSASIIGISMAAGIVFDSARISRQYA